MKNNKKQLGFTLVELMITVAIMGIIAAIANATYSDYVISSNRTDGRVALLENATVLEKCKALYGVYNNNCSITGSSSIPSKEGYYTITPSTLTSSTFTLTARPVSSGPQSKDTECTEITLTHLAVQGGSGSSSSECW